MKKKIKKKKDKDWHYNTVFVETLTKIRMPISTLMF